jgi:hypothetical protein
LLGLIVISLFVVIAVIMLRLLIASLVLDLWILLALSILGEHISVLLCAVRVDLVVVGCGCIDNVRWRMRVDNSRSAGQWLDLEGLALLVLVRSYGSVHMTIGEGVCYHCGKIDHLYLCRPLSETRLLDLLVFACHDDVGGSTSINTRMIVLNAWTQREEAITIHSVKVALGNT